ncbi:hypothetical protein BDR06DRAFT_1004972 [Suillus hirtellus]|nr:hypothetical protein BDR06DRAFT_1004972 [Suillus hirtellus]
MNKLISDPNLDQCPDFASAEFQGSRAPLLSPTSNDTQAAATLCTIWTVTNATLRAQWQLQLDTEALEAAEQQCLCAEAEMQRLAAQALQDATAAEEDQKKNRIHHIPIPDRPHPKRVAESFIVSDFALRKLDKALFVELYYWTNKGLADTRLNFLTTNDDSMVPTAAADGTTSWIAASVAHPAAGVITDCLLSPLDFS